MINTGPGWMKVPFRPGQLLFLGTLFFLPVLNPQLFSWLHGLLAVPVFFALTTNGRQAGAALIWVSLLLAGLGALLLQRVELFFFSLTMVPLGYTLYHSADKRESVATSGGKGVAILSLTWLFFWGLYGVTAGFNPYVNLLKVLDFGFQQTLEVYSSKEAGLSPEVIYNLQQITNNLRAITPKLLPGLLASMTIFTVWVNLVIANVLAGRQNNGSLPWGRYSSWKLPDQLIWLPIVAVSLLIVGHGPIQYGGVCLLLVSGLLYFFQGLAVVIALFERWNVPVLVRIILYFVLLIQSYSVVFLAVLGLSDVWFNMRQKSDER